jgi:hypothetical protein
MWLKIENYNVIVIRDYSFSSFPFLFCLSSVTDETDDCDDTVLESNQTQRNGRLLKWRHWSWRTNKETVMGLGNLNNTHYSLLIKMTRDCIGNVT